MRPRTPHAEPPSPAFAPVRILEVELSDGLPRIEATRTAAGVPHARVLVVARLHSEPLGTVELPLPEQGIAPSTLAEALWGSLGARIGEHLAEDGIAPLAGLTVDGIRTLGRPLCLSLRDRFLQSDPPQLSVLVPSRERPEPLRRCLESILACDYPAERFELVVVDNDPQSAGTRLLVAELAALSGGRVRYAREDRRGSASARNRGLEVAAHELVVMTDDDVLADRHWLTEVALAFSAHPDAWCVTGLLLPMELGTPAQLWFEGYGGFSRGFRERVFDLGDNRPGGEPLYPWAAGIFGTGNNFAFRASRLRAIGGFDPALGNGTPALGGVDSEVLLRVILEGGQIVYAPRAAVHHAHRADYAALRQQVYAYGVGLTAYYLKTLHDDPRRLVDFVQKIPVGLKWMLSSDAHINAHKQDDYPRELVWLERRGMAYGPWAYARSRRRYGRHLRPMPMQRTTS